MKTKTLSEKIIKKSRVHDFHDTLIFSDAKEHIQNAEKKIEERIEQFETDNHLRIDNKSIKSFVNLKKDLKEIFLKEFGEKLTERFCQECLREERNCVCKEKLK